MTPPRPPLAFAIAALGYGLLGFLEGPLGDARPLAPELRAALRLVVTTGADSGTGSLREAILTADRSAQRARIELRVPAIRLESVLPPLVAVMGVTIDAPEGPVVIDGSAVAGGALLDVAAPDTVLRGFEVRGAVDRAIAIRAAGARILGMRVVDCGEGVAVAAGGDSARVEDSTFVRNGTAVAVAGSVSGVVVAGNTFSGHDRAAVWAVAASPAVLGARQPLLVERNRFEDDRIAVVLLNVPGEVVGNHLLRPVEIGILMTGGAVLRGNRIEAGRAIGVLADAPSGAVLEDNEVSGVSGVGIVVRGARETELRNNQVYANGYGVAVVFGEPGLSALLTGNLVMGQRYDGVVVLGGAPVLRDNRILRNEGAGLRLLDYVPAASRRLPAVPRLESNAFEGNGSDAAVQGEYRAPESGS